MAISTTVSDGVAWYKRHIADLLILLIIVPPILLAAIAMQESTCQPNEVGGAGEQGLMQITKDKCEGRSPEACRDPVSCIVMSRSYYDLF